MVTLCHGNCPNIAWRWILNRPGKSLVCKVIDLCSLSQLCVTKQIWNSAVFKSSKKLFEIGRESLRNEWIIIVLKLAFGL